MASSVASSWFTWFRDRDRECARCYIKRNRPISRDVTKRARRAGRTACFVEDKEAFFLHELSHKRKMRLHAPTDIFKVFIFLRL